MMDAREIYRKVVRINRLSSAAQLLIEEAKDGSTACIWCEKFFVKNTAEKNARHNPDCVYVLLKGKASARLASLNQRISHSSTDE